jgi:hypothetical protein
LDFGSKEMTRSSPDAGSRRLAESTHFFQPSIRSTVDTDGQSERKTKVKTSLPAEIRDNCLEKFDRYREFRGDAVKQKHLKSTLKTFLRFLCYCGNRQWCRS